MRQTPSPTNSPTSGSAATATHADVRGATMPRRFTPPLVTGPPGPCGCGCALTPQTSEGFDAVRFAENVLRRRPRPWQRWLLIHGLELLPDGRPRFRTLLVLVSRQNGKTEVLVILAAYWLFVVAVPLVLGTSTKIEYAKESWQKMVTLARGVKALTRLRDKVWTRRTNGEQEAWTKEGARYKIAASNEEGGRSLTVHRLITDELRQHHTYGAWGAAVPAMNAVADGQNWCLSNAGSADSVVLNDLHAELLAALAGAAGDPRKGLFEWSAAETADPRDVAALVQANPSVGYGLDLEMLLGDALSAVAAGGDKLTSFKTEQMCVRVPKLSPAIDPGMWAACLDPAPLDGHRARLAMCVDVSPDGQHATAAVAAQYAGVVRVETVAAWDGADAAALMVAALPALVQRIRPRLLGWFPGGPAASVAADLQERRGWPPRGTEVSAIRGETAAVCMGFEELTRSGRLVHSGQALPDAQVQHAARRKIGEVQWVFERGGDAHVDAVYAMAGAAHLARTVPALIPVRMPVGSDEAAARLPTV